MVNFYVLTTDVDVSCTRKDVCAVIVSHSILFPFSVGLKSTERFTPC